MLTVHGEVLLTHVRGYAQVLLDIGLGIAFPGFPTDNLNESAGKSATSLDQQPIGLCMIVMDMSPQHLAVAVVGQKVAWGNHRFHTELEIEKFLVAAQTFIHEMQGGPTGADPNDIPGWMHGCISFSSCTFSSCLKRPQEAKW